jgi:hypothetical protein
LKEQNPPRFPALSLCQAESSYRTGQGRKRSRGAGEREEEEMRPRRLPRQSGRKPEALTKGPQEMRQQKSELTAGSGRK